MKFLTKRINKGKRREVRTRSRNNSEIIAVKERKITAREMSGMGEQVESVLFRYVFIKLK